MNLFSSDELQWVELIEQITPNELEMGDIFIVCTNNSFYSFTCIVDSWAGGVSIYYTFNGVTDKDGNPKKSDLPKKITSFLPAKIQKGERTRVVYLEENGLSSLTLSATKGIFLKKPEKGPRPNTQRLTELIIQELKKIREDAKKRKDEDAK